MGFTDVSVSDNRVFVLHSGRSYNEAGDEFSAGHELLVFDWEGNLQNTYNLDRPTTGISYDRPENALYAVSNTLDVPLFKIILPNE